VAARKTVTVLFTDVTGSTGLGEQLDPEAARRLFGRWFDEVRAVVERYGGTVEKFAGDAVLAVFGIPTVHEDDALRAVRTAVELSELDVPFATRTGVNTGEVATGEGETLLIGDAVNVAARLEQLAAPGEILIGEATYRLVSSAVEAEPTEPLGLRGRSEPVRAYRLLQVRSGAEAFARRFDTPLVGRDAELERLVAAHVQARVDGGCEVVTLIGEPGIGKSRLVRELVGRIEPETRVLSGRCLPYGEGITYWPLVEMVSRPGQQDAHTAIAELLDGDEEAGQIAERVSTALGGTESAASSDEIAWAVRRLFERLARERSLAVVVDDLQWAEPTFLDLLERLAYLWRGGPLLLVCLARPELLETRGNWPGAQVRLGPLSAEQSAELVRRLGGGPEERITRTAQGNPLFIEQLQAMLAGNGKDANGTIPPTISAVLGARLDGLDSHERRAIEAASVVGEEFWAGAVQTLASPGTEVGSALVGLIRQNLIRPGEEASFPGEDAFEFVHLLVRDAAYSGLTKERRSELHERLAAWLADRGREHGREHDEIVGYHLEQAFVLRRELGEHAQELAAAAAQRLDAAGRRALRRGDVGAAVILLSRAAELVPDGETLIELGFALDAAGRFADALGVIDRVRALADERGDERLAARAELAGLSVRERSDPSLRSEDVRASVERARPIFERAGDERGLAAAWEALSALDWIECRFQAAADGAENALVHARRSGDTRLEAELIATISRALTISAHVDTATARTEALLSEARDRPQLEADLLMDLALLHSARGDFEEAEELMERADSTFAELGQPPRRAMVARRRGDIRLIAGDLAGAEATIRDSLALFEELGDTARRSGAAAELADVLYRQGRYDEAEELTNLCERLASADDVESQAGLRLARAKVRARSGDHAQAEELALDARRLADGTDFIELRAFSLLGLGEVLALAGRDDEAASLIRQARDVFAAAGYAALVTLAAQTAAELGLTAPCG
jgi:class 3 adenylate cyclase/tetratricopeptide (TPR) repeat protein